MLTTLALTVVAAVGGWFLWNARTYGQRSTDAMLQAWPKLDQYKDGKRILGRESKAVFYHCRHNWTDQRAEVVVLERTARGQWFEAAGNEFDARMAAAFPTTNL